MIFDPFGDHAARGYLRNFAGEKHPDLIRALEHHAFRLNLPAAARALVARRSLTYQDLLNTHGRLFGDVYPWAGQDRQALTPDLAIGKAGRYDLFAHPSEIRRAADHALDRANDRAEMRSRPGYIIGILSYAHPFLEGNGRTILTLHVELCRRAGFWIDWDKIGKQDYLAVLMRELEQPGSAMDGFLKPFIQLEKPTVNRMLAALQANPSLGPDPAVTAALPPSERDPSDPL